MSQFDENFKSMDNKVKFDEKEKRELFFQINNKINTKQNKFLKLSSRWRYYLALSTAFLLLIVLSISHVTNDNQDRTSRIEHSEVVLNTEYLALDESANNEEVKHYLADSLEIAIGSLPFPLILPDEIPGSFHSFEPVYITDWNESHRGRDISIELAATSTVGNDDRLVIFARNFDINVLLDVFRGGEEIILDNEQVIYFTHPDESMASWHSATMSWIADDVFYSVEYKGSNIDANAVKPILLDLVKQMQ